MWSQGAGRKCCLLVGKTESASVSFPCPSVKRAKEALCYSQREFEAEGMERFRILCMVSYKGPLATLTQCNLQTQKTLHSFLSLEVDMVLINEISG